MHGLCLIGYVSDVLTQTRDDTIRQRSHLTDVIADVTHVQIMHQDYVRLLNEDQSDKKYTVVQAESRLDKYINHTLKQST